MQTDCPDPPEGIQDLQGIRCSVLDRELESYVEAARNGQLGSIIESELKTPKIALDEIHGDDLEEVVSNYLESLAVYREHCRPDSLRSTDELPEGVQRDSGAGWIYYYGSYSHEQAKELGDAQRGRGKYLFFSPVARLLENIVLQEFENRPFNRAKIVAEPSKKDDYVLCLYSGDNRYARELRDDYSNVPGLKYRSFKFDSDTAAGNYSEEFLSKLDDDERERWERDRSR